MRDLKSPPAIAERPAPTRIGSGDLLGRLLRYPFSSFLGKRKSPIWPLNSAMFSAKTNLLDKSKALQLVTMMMGHARNLANTMCNFFYCESGAFTRKYEEDALLFLGQLSDWLRVLKLLVQVSILALQTRYAAARLRKLTRQNLQLRVQRSQLLLRKSNALIFDRSRSEVSNDTFDRIKHNRPNEKS